MEKSPDFESFGVKLVYIVKEDIKNEIEDFVTLVGCPPEEIYIDSGHSFYATLGGGDKQAETMMTFLRKVMFGGRLKRNLDRAQAENPEITGNVSIGEGFIKGGLYVLCPDGTSEYAFFEEEIGDHAPLDAVMKAVERASQKQRSLQL
mmetsp:Transcript_19166/g.25997  ORF Transcript_19166/g.25997 Transcript_19166/m.25997 type:complete len:148 (-) Transcript_19166:319-762(-)